MQNNKKKSDKSKRGCGTGHEEKKKSSKHSTCHEPVDKEDQMEYMEDESAYRDDDDYY